MALTTGVRLGAAGRRRTPEQRAFEQPARLLRAPRPADPPGDAETSSLYGLLGPTWRWDSWLWSPPAGLCAGGHGLPWGRLLARAGQPARSPGLWKEGETLTLVACAPGPDGWCGVVWCGPHVQAPRPPGPPLSAKIACTPGSL